VLKWKSCAKQELALHSHCLVKSVRIILKVNEQLVIGAVIKEMAEFILNDDKELVGKSTMRMVLKKYWKSRQYAGVVTQITCCLILFGAGCSASRSLLVSTTCSVALGIQHLCNYSSQFADPLPHKDCVSYWSIFVSFVGRYTRSISMKRPKPIRLWIPQCLQWKSFLCAKLCLCPSL
jgi:hypothetical protein